MMARAVFRVVLLLVAFAGCATVTPPAPPVSVASSGPAAALGARYSLGVVRYVEGDLDGAIESYRRVVAAAPRQADARYNLALLLKLADRHAEAVPEFVAAAEAGHPRAQYFAGAAYATGVGVEQSLTSAVTWWLLAAEQGVTQADEALVQLRDLARGRMPGRARRP